MNSCSDKTRLFLGIALVLVLFVASRIPLDAQSAVVREDDIAYALRADLTLKLDLARPATGEGPFPAIVYIIDDWAHASFCAPSPPLSIIVPSVY